MVKRFDVFLCHNSKDKAAVLKLAEELRARKLSVWLDQWELPPGYLFQEALEEIIETTRAAAVLVGKDGLGPWQSMEMRAILEEFADRKLPVIPVLLPGAPKRPKLPIFLRGFTWVDLSGGLDEGELDRLQWGATGERPDRSKLPPTPAALSLEAGVAAAGAQPTFTQVSLAPPETHKPAVVSQERPAQNTWVVRGAAGPRVGRRTALRIAIVVLATLLAGSGVIYLLTRLPDGLEESIQEKPAPKINHQQLPSMQSGSPQRKTAESPNAPATTVSASRDHQPSIYLANAIAKGDTEAIDLWIERGAKFTPQCLIEATFRRDLKMIKGIIDSGVPIDCRGDAPRYFALGAFCSPDNPLSVAVCRLDRQVTDFLLRNGADPNFLNKNSQSQLLMAYYGRASSLTGLSSLDDPDFFAVASQLIAAGANIDSQDQGGQTLLIKATEGNQESVVSFLLEKGARRDISDKSGRTAEEYAEQNENVKLIKMLSKREG